MTPRALLLGLLLLSVGALAEVPVHTVGEVGLQRRGDLPEAELLDVGVVVFEAGLEEAGDPGPGVYPRVRKVESTFLPVNLRQALVDSNAWGVVRVLPEPSALSELNVRARLLQSTGLRLQLEVRVEDATGALWFERRYVASSSDADFPVQPGDDPFRDLYHQVANEMLAYRDALGSDRLREIRRVAFLRYARSLSPETFSGYLGEADGIYRVQRLPAEGDGMIERVERIRNQEYLFVDNVDEQYTRLQREMAPAYNLWRQYDREQAIFRAEYEQRVAERGRQGRRGSFSAMQQVYNQYKVAKTQQQDIRELARGFDNETAPTVLETSGRIFRLTGTLDSQYSEWRQILRRIFALETGLPEAQ